MHDDTDWFRGYVAGLEEAVSVLREQGLARSIYADAPTGLGLLINYLDQVKREQMPRPTGACPDGSR